MMMIAITNWLANWFPTIVTALFLLGMFHFIYEGIILPNIQTEIRFKLFALRDQLRRLKIEHPGVCSHQMFMLQQESLNNSIHIIPYAGIYLLQRVKSQLRNKPQLKRKIEYRAQLLESCDNPTISVIRDKQFVLFLWAIFANSGGLTLYLLPLAMPVFLVALYGAMKKRVRYHQMEAVVNMTESEMKEFTPSIIDGDFAAA